MHVSASGIAILKFYDVNTIVLSTGGCNFDVLVDKSYYTCICQTRIDEVHIHVFRHLYH